MAHCNLFDKKNDAWAQIQSLKLENICKNVQFYKESVSREILSVFFILQNLTFFENISQFKLCICAHALFFSVS